MKLNQKITITFPLWSIFLIPLGLYFVWEVYWYNQVGLRFIKWHTHLMVPIYIFLIGLVFLKLIFRKSTETFKNSLLAFSSFMIAVFLVELMLTVTGMNKTYMEIASNNYDSHYIPGNSTHYHVWTPNIPHYLTKPEFSFWRPTNSLGFADIEWSVQKEPDQLRILALGDSFTEGDGAPNDSSYVALFKNKLDSADGSFYVMNGGICGSDPFNNYINLKDLLIKYQPDFIIQTLATHDLTTDILLRGGMERFQTDGTLKYTNAPWWEPIYALSYVSRIFFHMAGYNELLRKEDLSAEDEERVNKQVIDLFKEYANFCRQSNIKLTIVLRPDRNEIEDNRYSFDFSTILQELQLIEGVEIIDLLPEYKKYIAEKGTKAENYFWVYDGHHNSDGYEMMAQTILENLSFFNYQPLTKNENQTDEKN